MTGISNLVTVIESTLRINSGSVQQIRSNSTFIFSLFYSDSNLSNLNFSQFYPRLIYASFSRINISDCSFGSSFEKFGIFEVCAIFFEYNMTFIIKNSRFYSLSNNYTGAVIIHYFILFLLILKGYIFQSNFECSI